MTAACAHDYDAVADVIYRGGGWDAADFEAFPCCCCGPGRPNGSRCFPSPAQGLGFVRIPENMATIMAMAALNMMEKIAFNALRPEGFTSSEFCHGWAEDRYGCQDLYQRDLSTSPKTITSIPMRTAWCAGDSLFRELAW